MRQALPSRISRFVDATWRHPANQGFERVSAVSKALAWELYDRVATRRLPWSVNIHSGMRIYCYPGCNGAKWVMCTRGWKDWFEMGFVKHYLRPGDNFLDVGANIGFYSLLASTLIGSTGTVDAFEPTPSTALRLQENLDLNGINCVRVHQAAVGNAADIVRFQEERDDSLNRIRTGNDSDAGDIEVHCVRLTDVVGDRQYALGKMDIEGAELAALQGAEPMLANQNPPVWLLEVNERLRDYGYTESEFWGWLTSRGYDIAVYNSDTRDVQFVDKNWLCQLDRSENVLAIARTQREFVIERVTST